MVLVFVLTFSFTALKIEPAVRASCFLTCAVQQWSWLTATFIL